LFLQTEDNTIRQTEMIGSQRTRTTAQITTNDTQFTVIDVSIIHNRLLISNKERFKNSNAISNSSKTAD